VFRALLCTIIVALNIAGIPSPASREPSRSVQDPWISVFAVQKSELGPTGRNTYFILEPGHVAEFRNGDERLVVTVLSDTKVVDGVTTRVVEERETRAGALVEVSRNYFAISSRTNDVYYFGEDVDMYEEGRVVSHEGSWRAGVNSARFGLMMPGKPVPGLRHYQEVAAGQAMDRAEIVSLTEVVRTPAGTYRNCLKVAETTPLEPGAREFKFYAPGVGLVQDGAMKKIGDRR
jgi:hypothetical protein